MIMRLSANALSSFYDPAKVQRAKIYVDGREIRRCFEASEEEGWADVFAVGMDGKPLVDETGDRVQVERLRGRVEIIIPPTG